jgi:hypothetical protein
MDFGARIAGPVHADVVVRAGILFLLLHLVFTVRGAVTDNLANDRVTFLIL